MEKYRAIIEKMRAKNPTDSEWNALIEKAADDYTITDDEYWEIFETVMEIIVEEFGI